MVDISCLLRNWVECCREVWTKWFMERENGEDEFYEVEAALFSALVLSDFLDCHRPPLHEVYPRLEASYLDDLQAVRPVCRKQKAGNIFCEARRVEFKKGSKFKRLRITLRYADELNRLSPLNQLQRVSTPGRRVYVGRRQLPRVRGGFGISILSTSRGVLSDKEARKHHIGGELLVKVW